MYVHILKGLVMRTTVVGAALLVAACSGGNRSTASSSSTGSSGTSGGTSGTTSPVCSNGASTTGSNVVCGAVNFSPTVLEGWYDSFPDGGLNTSKAFIDLNDGPSSCSADQAGAIDLGTDDVLIQLDDLDGGSVGPGTYEHRNYAPKLLSYVIYSQMFPDGGVSRQFAAFGDGSVTLVSASLNSGFAGSFEVALQAIDPDMSDGGPLAGQFDAPYCQLPPP